MNFYVEKLHSRSNIRNIALPTKFETPLDHTGVRRVLKHCGVTRLSTTLWFYNTEVRQERIKASVAFWQNSKTKEGILICGAKLWKGETFLLDAVSLEWKHVEIGVITLLKLSKDSYKGN